MLTKPLKSLYIFLPIKRQTNKQTNKANKPFASIYEYILNSPCPGAITIQNSIAHGSFGGFFNIYISFSSLSRKTTSDSIPLFTVHSLGELRL